MNRRSAYTRRANKDAAASCERFMNTGRRAAAAADSRPHPRLFVQPFECPGPENLGEGSRNIACHSNSTGLLEPAVWGKVEVTVDDD